MKKIKLNYSFENTVATITLDDGKVNILDHIMMEELQQVLDDFKNKPELKLIVFEGAGKHFSFGASVEEHKRELAEEMLSKFHHLFYSLSDLAIPIAAKITGQCLGGGLDLSLMCNFMFADKSAKLGQPEILLGVIAPAASVLLQEKIGLAHAEDLLLTGRTITADDAKSWGLLNEVFESRNEMDSGVDKWIETYIVPKSASSLRYSVKASRAKLSHLMSNFLPQLESLYVNRLMNTPDANEGIQAFLEKRKPVWETYEIVTHLK